jgi:glucan phosphoethanolaminetransferase (alkaline phosphatase superfamily)
MAISTALKVKFSFLSALIFFLVANPVTFRFVNSIIPGVASNGCPTAFGFILHTVVFFLVSFAVMLFPKDPE